jgi:CrcB protein
MIQTAVAVFIGGGLGSLVRLWIQQQLNPSQPGEFPMGTLLVNFLGCLLIGLLWGWSEKTMTLTPTIKFFLFTGICGGFTTFSAYSQESLVLFRNGQTTLFVVYTVGSIIGSLLLTLLGYKLFVQT